MAAPSNCVRCPPASIADPRDRRATTTQGMSTAEPLPTAFVTFFVVIDPIGVAEVARGFARGAA